MYLLFLDESGTHGGSSVFIVGGLALHEQDAWPLQSRIEAEFSRALPEGIASGGLELHGSEIRNSKQGKSDWFGLPLAVRDRVLRMVVQALANYRPIDPQKAPALFAFCDRPVLRRLRGAGIRRDSQPI